MTKVPVTALGSADDRRVIDPYRGHRDEYAAASTPALLRVGRAKYLTIEGRSKPGSADFQQRMQVLKWRPENS